MPPASPSKKHKGDSAVPRGPRTLRNADPVSLSAAAVQARPGPARPEAAVEISRTSSTARSFLNCVPGVRVTPGAPISRVISDHPSELRRSCGGTCLTLVRRPGREYRAARRRAARKRTLVKGLRVLVALISQELNSAQGATGLSEKALVTQTRAEVVLEGGATVGTSNAAAEQSVFGNRVVLRYCENVWGHFTRGWLSHS